MGIPQFLQELLPLAGRPLDLTTFDDPDEDDETTRPPTNAEGGGEEATRKHRDKVLEEEYRDRLRVGVDVSSWIYRACLGFSDMLGDERHLTNLGRADLLLQEQERRQQDEQEKETLITPLEHIAGDQESKQDTEGSVDELDTIAQQYVAACTDQVKKKLVKLNTYVDILVVLDGATPPIKAPTSTSRSEARQVFLQQREDTTVDPTGQDIDQRIKAFKRAGAGKYYSTVVSNLIQECRHCKIPFLVAPYEADGQLGYLSDQGLLHLVVSEDSDLMACACSHVLYKLNDRLQGTMLRRHDMFASPLLQDFSDAMLAVVFVACGSDYCEKLKGIGFKTAVKIVRQVYFDDKAKSSKSTNDSSTPTPLPPLQRVLQRLFTDTWDASTLTPEFKSEFERKFLSALLMYRHPVVLDPLSGRTVVARGDRGRPIDPELSSYPPYVNLYQQHLHSIVGDLIPSPLCIHIAEGWISPRTLRPYPMMGGAQPLPPSVHDYLKKQSNTSSSARSTSTMNEDHEDDIVTTTTS